MISIFPLSLRRLYNLMSTLLCMFNFSLSFFSHHTIYISYINMLAICKFTFLYTSLYYHYSLYSLYKIRGFMILLSSLSLFFSFSLSLTRQITQTYIYIYTYTLL
ncbi:hypothetical protein BDC45DRAFT_511842 [Circinella umbellata]|nr:hypothetical protein BDC45DRAFT_511842 [Circinella umbellata]